MLVLLDSYDEMQHRVFKTYKAESIYIATDQSNQFLDHEKQIS